jgi:hypothetical protein
VDFLSVTQLKPNGTKTKALPSADVNLISNDLVCVCVCVCVGVCVCVRVMHFWIYIIRFEGKQLE